MRVAGLLIALVAFVAAGAASSVAAPGRGAQDATSPEPALTQAQQRARMRTTAWLPSWDLERSRSNLRDNQRFVGRLSPFWFDLSENGRLVTRRDGALDAEVLALARDRRMTLIPTITNDYDGVRVQHMLSSAASRRRHVDQLVALATRSGFAGIDVDYEDVAPAERARFTSFVQELARQLHARHLVLSVDLPARTSSAADAIGEEPYDLAAIGAAADEVRIMAYDYSTPCTGSGPIAPIDWVRRVVEHTVDLVPARKVVLGIPLYGYDWTSTGCATSHTWQDTDQLRVQYSGTLGWSNPFQSRQLRYVAARQKHLVWFEDSRSTAAKLRIAHEFRLRGIALWRLGGEDPRTWTMLAQVLGQART